MIAWIIMFFSSAAAFPAGFLGNCPTFLKAASKTLPFKNPVRFSFITDTHDGVAKTETFVEQILRTAPDFVIHGGDMVQHGRNPQELEQFQSAMRPIVDQNPLFIAMGNHDVDRGRGTMHLMRIFGGHPRDAFYDVVTGPVHLIFLSSELTRRTDQDRQIEWLKSTLQKACHWRIVILHRPPFSSANVITNHDRWLIDRLVPVFEAYKVDLVLSGHSHYAEHSRKNGVNYWVGGPAGGFLQGAFNVNPYSLWRVAHPLSTVTHFVASESEISSTTTDLDGKETYRFLLKKESQVRVSY